MLLESLDYTLFVDEIKFSKLNKKIESRIKKAQSSTKVKSKQASLPFLTKDNTFKLDDETETDETAAQSLIP